MVVEQASIGKGLFKNFNNKSALMRAYRSSCLGGKKADWVERKEFPFLIRNLFFFDVFSFSTFKVEEAERRALAEVEEVRLREDDQC